MQRMGAASAPIDDNHLAHMLAQIRSHVQQEYKQEVESIRVELAGLQIRASRAEILEVENEKMRKELAAVKLESQKRVEEAQHQVMATHEKHEAIHAGHNATIAAQQKTILELNEQIKCMEEYKEPETVDHGHYAKEMKDYMLTCMSDMKKSIQQSKPAAAKPVQQKVPPVIDYKVEYDSTGMIRNIVAKPR